MAETLTIVCVTYGQDHELKTLISSLRCQTRRDWRLAILHDGPHAALGANLAAHGFLDEQVEFHETAVRANDYGHSLRDLGIREHARGDWLLLTNGDNYYCPRFVEYMLAEAERDPAAGLVYCDMVHSHNRPDSSSGSDYGYFATEIRRLSVMEQQALVNSGVVAGGDAGVPQYSIRLDIGAFIVRRDIAQAVGFNHRDHDADGRFVLDILRAYGNSITCRKVPKVLFVHN
jgi:GT2 family glycosyltransferase